MDTTASDRLQQANECHDDEPERGAELLRGIAPGELAPREKPLYGFLLNHVFGEKFGRWAEANTLQQALLASGPEAPAVALWRHAGVAARLAGDRAAADGASLGLQTAGAADAASADALIGLAAASMQAGALPAAEAGALALAMAMPLDAIQAAPSPALDASFGAVTNNLATDLAERPLADLRDAALRRALVQLADHALRFWLRAGQWVQHERAHYLVAVAANAVGDAASAAAAARSGLALLDTHDGEHAEDVDRAFLEQELAHALAMLGDVDAAAAQARADALAAGFGDAGLDRWFADRAARCLALRGAAGPA